MECPVDFHLTYFRSHKECPLRHLLGTTPRTTLLYTFTLSVGARKIVPIAPFRCFSHSIQTIDAHIWRHRQTCFQRVDPSFDPFLVQFYLFSCLSNTMRVICSYPFSKPRGIVVPDQAVKWVRSMGHKIVQWLRHRSVTKNRIVSSLCRHFLKIQHRAVTVRLIGGVIGRL